MILNKNKNDQSSYIKRYNFIKLGYFNQKNNFNYGYKLHSNTTFYNNIFNCSIYLEYIPKDKIIPNINNLNYLNKYEIHFTNNFSEEKININNDSSNISLYKEDNIKYQLLFRECLYNKNFDLLDLLFKSVHINISLDIEYDILSQFKNTNNKMIDNTDYKDKIKESYDTLFNDLLIKIKQFSQVQGKSSINNLNSGSFSARQFFVSSIFWKSQSSAKTSECNTS